VILHPALRYVLVTRWRNRARAWLRTLKTGKGLLIALVFSLAGVGLLTGGGLGTRLPVEQREASLVALLGFMLLMQVLSGIGQRGLVFSPADLDQLFPAPFRRRDLLLYHFLTHYVLALLVAFFFALFFGGTSMPSFAGLVLGIALYQMLCAHVQAAAAEVSMILSDRVHERVSRLSRVPIALVSVAGILLVVGVITGMGDLPAYLDRALQSPALQVLLYPAEQAVALGARAGVWARLPALAGLAGCVVASFALVCALPVDLLEASFLSSRKVSRARRDMKRGVISTERGRTVSSTPRSGWYRGAGSVLWLNVLTLRRQLRALIGGAIMVSVMLLVLGRRESAEEGLPLFLLAMIPLWVTLPIGFRLPREQLVTIQLLPIPSFRLAAGLIALPVLVPLGLQSIALASLLLLGHVEPALLVPALVAYASVNLSAIAVEGVFVLKRAQPNSVNMVHAIAQVFCQFLALLPGLLTLGVGFGLARSMPVAILAGALVQIGVGLWLVRFLGRRLRAQVPDANATLA
jgi:hypothetical protein